MEVGKLKTIVRSLSFRLFLWLFFVIAIVFFFYTYNTNLATSKIWREILQQSASRTSEMIKRSTHYGMLLNQKEDVHHTIRRLARGPGVVGIRIYDKKGVIIFSSDANEISRRVNLKDEGCVICHEVGAPLGAVPARSKVRIYRGNKGEKILGLINPIENEAACSSAKCHAHPPEKTMLGVLDVRLSMAFADQGLKEARRRTLWATLLLAFLIAAVTGVFIFRMVRVPVRRLIDATRHVALGDFAQRINGKRKDEFGELAAAFDRMIEDLRISKGEVAEKSVELSRAQRQIIHMEKMASLGKLAATVAHELNNPIAGILNYAKLVAREIRDDTLTDASKSEIVRYLEMIQKESGRCGEIVRNLLLFTRRSEIKFTMHGLNDIIDRALMVVRHRLEMSGIQLSHQTLKQDDSIYCDADQLQQAFVALLVNAAEAMPEGGTLSVSAEKNEDIFQVQIADTGVGIHQDVLQKIYEPFFSTKEKATGVGLGLSVAYGIVQRHNGVIDADSVVNKGTTFRVMLPQKPALGA